MDTPTLPDPRTRLAMLEALVTQQARQQAEIATLTARLLAEGQVDPGELVHLHQRARASAAAHG